MSLSLVPQGVQDHVRSICAEVVAAAARADQGVRNVWGYATTADHNNRRCVDYMVTSRARGDWVAQYHWTHRKRLGLDLIIWNRRIRRTYRKGLIPAGVWAPYRGASAHTDHVHAQYAAGTYLRPTHPALGAYVVDPAKVTTWLWEVRRDGSLGAKRRPGYRIRDAYTVERRDGREWVVTEGGSRYALEFLKRT